MGHIVICRDDSGVASCEVRTPSRLAARPLSQDTYEMVKMVIHSALHEALRTALRSALSSALRIVQGL